MTAHDTRETVAGGLDRVYLVDTLSRLARVPTGVDFVTLSDVETEARVLAHLILTELT